MANVYPQGIYYPMFIGSHGFVPTITVTATGATFYAGPPEPPREPAFMSEFDEVEP